MANVDLTETQAAFLETWLDAILPDPEAGDTEALVAQIDTDNLDLSDIWLMARSRAEASLGALRVALENEDDPNLERIAQFGLMDVMGGNHTQITARILGYGMAAPGDRAKAAEALDAALLTLEKHLDQSPFVDLVENNAFDVSVSIRAPLRAGIDAIRRQIAR